jgi:hypothetical protein
VAKTLLPQQRLRKVNPTAFAVRLLRPLCPQQLRVRREELAVQTMVPGLRVASAATHRLQSLQ